MIKRIIDDFFNEMNKRKIINDKNKPHLPYLFNNDDKIYANDYLNNLLIQINEFQQIKSYKISHKKLSLLLFYAFGIGNEDLISQIIIMLGDIDLIDYDILLDSSNYLPDIILTHNNPNIIKLFLSIPNMDDVYSNIHDYDVPTFDDLVINYSESAKYIIDHKFSQNTLSYGVLYEFFIHSISSNFELFKWLYHKFQYVESLVEKQDNNFNSSIIINEDNDITPIILLLIAKNNSYNSILCCKYIFNIYKKPIIYKYDIIKIFDAYENNGDFLYDESYFINSNHGFDPTYSIEIMLVYAVRHKNYGIIKILIDKKIDVNKPIYLIIDMMEIFPNTKDDDYSDVLYFLLFNGFCYDADKYDLIKNKYLKYMYSNLYRWWLKLDYLYFDKHLLKTIINYL